MPGTPASSARSTCRPRRFYGSTRPASTPSRRPRPGSAAPSVIKLIAILTWVHNLRPRAGALKCFGELYLFSNCDHLWLCTNKPTHFKALKGFEQVEFKLSFWAVEPWWSTQLTLKFKTVFNMVSILNWCHSRNSTSTPTNTTLKRSWSPGSLATPARSTSPARMRSTTMLFR